MVSARAAHGGDRERTKRISVGVHDDEGASYAVSLSIDEIAGEGRLSIARLADGTSRQFELSQMKKSADGRSLQCKVSGATTTLSLDDEANPPEIRVVARLLFPVFDGRYRIERPEQRRLVRWIRTLALDAA
jgi:hypothetical protein